MRYWRQPLDIDQVKIPRGEVHVLVDRCKGCGFCVEFCPKEVLEMSAGFNAKGYHAPQVIEGAECVNCKLCEMICPDFAIYSVPLPNGEPCVAPARIMPPGPASKEDTR